MNNTSKKRGTGCSEEIIFIKDFKSVEELKKDIRKRIASHKKCKYIVQDKGEFISLLFK